MSYRQRLDTVDERAADHEGDAEHDVGVDGRVIPDDRKEKALA